jgi:hypothetical protein
VSAASGGAVRRGEAMKKKGTTRATKRGRQSDLSAKAARSVKGGPMDVKGGAVFPWKLVPIKGESFSVDMGTSENLKR